MSVQPPPPPSDTAASKTLNYYQILQVDSGATMTVIRYAYRYLAAMYHPDNAETADIEKFKLVTDAWRVLSDPNKRNAYDLQANIALAAMTPSTLQSAMGRASSSAPGSTINAKSNMPASTASPVPKNPLTAQDKPSAQPIPPDWTQSLEPKAGTAWTEVELRLGVLQILLDVRRKKPQSGGATANLLMDCLGVELTEMEYILWYLREKGYIEREEAQFVITISGVDYLVDQLSKTEILNPKRT